MRRNCPHCGTDQQVADEKLAAGWIFLKCHHCSALSPIQGRASQNLAAAADRPLRSLKPVAPPEPVLAKIDEPRVDLSLKAEPSKIILDVAGPDVVGNDEPSVFESQSVTSEPVPLLLEEEEAPSGRMIRARAYVLPLVLAIVCFGSGGYLIRSARLIRQEGWVFSEPNAAPVPSDLAPVSAPAAAPAPVTAAAPAPAERKPASTSVAASAPVDAEKRVEVLSANAVLRAGPGLHYNKVGTARAELQLLVKGSFDNWIEVRTGEGAKTAWIRSDLVKPLKQVAQQEAQP